jgi:hypothetical protein
MTSALLRDEDAGAEGLPAGVLEDHVDVLAAGQLADLLPKRFHSLGCCLPSFQNW